VLWGDPHINVFDSDVLREDGRGSSVKMFDHGDYWIVKSKSVFVQGRYWSTREDGASSTRALAVSGPFVQNHRLLVEPLDGKVTWDGESILQSFPSEKEIPGLLVARYGDASERIRDGRKHSSVRSVVLELPLGVDVTVNRWGDHIDAMITMMRLPGEKIDGHCGNYNGDASDDTTELIKARMGAEVSGASNLFTRKSYSYLGCFEDKQSHRDLPVFKGLHMKMEECALACSSYDYFGNQWKRECWCGNHAGRHGRVNQTDCSCGSDFIGNNRNCVYRYHGGLAAVPRRSVSTRLADCAPEARAEALELCREAADDAGTPASDGFLESCAMDVCLEGPEYARAGAVMRRQRIARAHSTSASHPNMRFAVPVHGKGPVRWATHPDLCLHVPGEVRKGANVELARCEEADAFVLPANGLGQIRLDRSPEWCLDVSAGQRFNGNNLQLWRCGNDHPNMRFTVPLTGEGLLRWASHPEFCVDVSAGGTRPGTNVQFWRCE